MSLEIAEILSKFLDDAKIIDMVFYKDHVSNTYYVEVYSVCDTLPTPIQVSGASLEEALWKAVENFDYLSTKDTN